MELKYEKDIPQTLQEDFVENRVIPLVGAGFSKNAILPSGMSIPDWNQLGKEVAKYLPDYEYISPVDALSLFESQFSRVKLVELLSKLLHIHDLAPGKAHYAFCNVFFDTICTTNFDFLLEHTLQTTKRPHSIIVSEDRLPISTSAETKLIKLHGDFNHPEKMVITEQDYDTYLDKNKIMATYISNLFITKTLFLVGYSFEDNDIRNIWKIIGSRLGRLHRPAYAVLVDANPIEVSRFERRDIRVINLKGKKSDYPSILTNFFNDIKQIIEIKSPECITATTERASEELKLPTASKRLCFISASYKKVAFLKELIYPALVENEVTPITLNEVIMPGDNWMSKSETLLRESSFAIVDISDSNPNVMWELRTISAQRKPTIVICDRHTHDSAFQRLGYNILFYDVRGDNIDFMDCLTSKIKEIVEPVFQQEHNEPIRLLQKGEYAAAVISCFRQLETALKSYFCATASLQSVPLTLMQMLRALKGTNCPQDLLEKVIEDTHIRNRVVHEAINVNKRTATDIVINTTDLIGYLNQNTDLPNKVNL